MEDGVFKRFMSRKCHKMRLNNVVSKLHNIAPTGPRGLY